MSEKIDLEFPYMAKKRVLQLGEGSLAVLLPCAWIRKNKIVKGSEVIVLANERVIIEPATQARIHQINEAVKVLAYKEEGKPYGG